MAKQKTALIVWLRRLVQTACLLFFLSLFLQTVFHPGNVKEGLLTLFFDLDPLVMLTLWLGGHAVASALLLSLITLVLTLVFGRWFCGWICPFGALHNFFTGLRDTRKKQRRRTGGYSVWQKSKYHLLALVLIIAFVGPNLAGWLDPFSFLYRSLATAVFPAVNAGFQEVFGWMYKTNPMGLAAVSEPIHGVLRQYFLTLEQPQFRWGMLFGLLFGAVILLNFFRARFWCRYICPLGGLLGVAGKNPIFRLRVDPDRCNNCLNCVAECQGGANPMGGEGWKPSECLFCWNCHSGCPTDAITFEFNVPGRTS